MTTRPTPPKYRGVCWHKKDRRWRVKIERHSRCYWLGNWTSQEDAARVYDCAARLVWGPDAVLNFPTERLPPPHIPEAKILAMMVEKGLLR